MGVVWFGLFGYHYVFSFWICVCVFACLGWFSLGFCCLFDCLFMTFVALVFLVVYC